MSCIRTLNLHHFYEYKRDESGWGGAYTINVDMLKKWKGDTFIVIFSPGTDHMLKQFEKQADKYNVIFRGNKAVNHVHPGAPRNTIIVFELK